MRDVERAVLSAIIAAADSRGRVVLDKQDLARATGFSPSICCNARTRLIQLKRIRKIGFSRPMVLQLIEPSNDP